MGLGITLKEHDVELSICLRKESKIFAKELRQLADKIETTCKDVEIRNVLIDNNILQPQYSQLIIVAPRVDGIDYVNDTESDILIRKYEEALYIADSKENLKCHVLEIKNKIKKLQDTEYQVTALDEVWVEYFLKKNK